MKLHSNFALLALCAALTLLTSCRKDETADDQAAMKTSTEALSVQSETEEVESMSYEAMEEAKNAPGATSYQLQSFPCAVVTHDTAAKTLTISFNQCVGAVYGVVREGSFVITYTGTPQQAGNSWSIDFNNYSANDNAIDGTLSVTRSGNLSVTTVADLTLTKANGDQVTYVGTRTRTWTAGAGTLDLWDDQFSIEGNAAGIDSEGNSYSLNIIDALLLKTECLQDSFYLPVSGIMTLNSPAYNFPITVNFGNGSCDNQVTLTIRNRDYPVTL